MALMDSRKGYLGVEETNTVKDNGRPKLLIIGKTGTGKSSLCNVITGYDHNADIYPVSSDPESCTQRTKFANVFFNGDQKLPISLIDTIGFDDATKNEDAAIIAELVSKLNNDCDHVNLFVIAVNGMNPRLDGSLVAIIRIFEGMFTEEFWKKAVVVFTRVQMDKKSKKRRETINMKSDDELAANYMKVVEGLFPEGKGLQYLHLDACFDKTDEDESTAFHSALGSLRRSLEGSSGLPTASIRRVETQNEVLRREIKEQEERRRIAETQFKEALQKLGQDAADDKEQYKAEMQRIIEEHEKKTEQERRETEMLHQQQIQEFRKAGELRDAQRRRELEDLRNEHEAKGLPSNTIWDNLKDFIAKITTPVIMVIDAIFKNKR